MRVIVFEFLPSLYAVIERLQCVLAWFGVLTAVGFLTPYQPPSVAMTVHYRRAVVSQW
jgi:TRAP-type mannitol/chloroaromatic compound transport system permease large subunit